MKPLTYIAGPYKSDPVHNTRTAWEVADTLILGGLVTPFVPHLTLLADAMCPRPEAFWLAYDLDVLEHCDAVLRLEGASAGADAEVVFALERDIPVFGEVGALLAWARGWAPKTSTARCVRAGCLSSLGIESGDAEAVGVGRGVFRRLPEGLVCLECIEREAVA